MKRTECSCSEHNCAGKRCFNRGKHSLKIIYFNKTGWFCDSCRDDLANDGLIILEEIGDAKI
jgi:hypothetical protein